MDPYRRRYYPDTERPDWHRVAVGDLWDEIGKLQFDFLVREGLQPHHALLDIGCGALRGGVHFVRYLDQGNYVGTDISEDLLRVGMEELARQGLAGKDAMLIHDGDFYLDGLGKRIDYALAQSLFTHIPPLDITQCLCGVIDVLVPTGRFYATFLEAPDGVTEMPRTDPPTGLPFVSSLTADPYHQSLAFYERLCEDIGLTVEYIGAWDHPRNQMMLRFTRR